MIALLVRAQKSNLSHHLLWWWLFLQASEILNTFVFALRNWDGIQDKAQIKGVGKMYLKKALNFFLRITNC